MNYDIDLRSAEYIASTRSFKTGAGRLIITLCLLVLPLAFYYGLAEYRAHLEKTTAALEADIAALSLRAQPLISMKTESEQLRQIALLETNLNKRKTPLPSFIREIRAAAPHNLQLNSIVIKPDHSIEITGIGVEMQKPALFRQKIADLSFCGHTELKSVSMNPHNGYSFTIHSVLISPGEDADNED